MNQPMSENQEILLGVLVLIKTKTLIYLSKMKKKGEQEIKRTSWDQVTMWRSFFLELEYSFPSFFLGSCCGIGFLISPLSHQSHSLSLSLGLGRSLIPLSKPSCIIQLKPKSFLSYIIKKMARPQKKQRNPSLSFS